MPEILTGRNPWRIGAGAVMGIGSLLITAGAVEGRYDQDPAIEVEAGSAGRWSAASFGEPVIAELCLPEFLDPETEANCDLPDTTVPTTPEITIPSPDQLIDEAEAVVSTTTTQPVTTTTTPPPLPTTMAPPPPPPPPSGGKADWMNQAGISADNQGYVDYIMTDESEWNPAAVSRNGCIGLGQNCPDQNGNYWLDDACPQWQDDPVCQLRRFQEYAIGRYGSWREAYDFKQRKGWW